MVSIFRDFIGPDDEVLNELAGDRIVVRSGATREEGRKCETEDCSLHNVGDNSDRG